MSQQIAGDLDLSFASSAKLRQNAAPRARRQQTNARQSGAFTPPAPAIGNSADEEVSQHGWLHSVEATDAGIRPIEARLAAIAQDMASFGKGSSVGIEIKAPIPDRSSEFFA